jgi:menaquinone-dependent protoporphyrinogen oxidase
MILVAYATKHGSTYEVAEAVARALAEEGLTVAVASADTLESVDEYDGVILGSGLYMGRMHAESRRFLRRFGNELARMPFAVFGMGPRTLEPDEVDASHTQLERSLARFPELEPFAIEVFGGVVDPTKLHFPLSRMPASDARDWDAIRAWARGLAAPLNRASVAV